MKLTDSVPNFECLWFSFALQEQEYHLVSTLRYQLILLCALYLTSSSMEHLTVIGFDNFIPYINQMLGVRGTRMFSVFLYDHSWIKATIMVRSIGETKDDREATVVFHRRDWKGGQKEVHNVLQTQFSFQMLFVYTHKYSSFTNEVLFMASVNREIPFGSKHVVVLSSQ